MGLRLEPEQIEEPVDAPTRDAGYSLTEAIVAVLLMSIAVVPIILAAGVSVRSSSQSRTLARVETVLSNAADRVNRAPESCDYTVYVQAAALAEGWEVSQTTVNYKYYEPAATALTEGNWVAGACPNGTRPDGLVQMVTITVAGPDGKTLRSIQVVKSDV
jgi:Tfp pilus assembly protein PilV